MVKEVPRFCPECNLVYGVVKFDDLRYKFHHQKTDRCSRSDTEFCRPIAQFIVFI